MKDKRGITYAWGFFISIVGVIIALVILIYFISILDLGETIDNEGCHASVVARSTLNLGKLVEAGRDHIPLNCRTEKICISGSGKNCEDATEFQKSKNNPVEKVKIGNDPEEIVLNTIAESLYDCHSMYGEGKLNFMPSPKWSHNYCIVCSRIALDEEARVKVGDISYAALYRHLQQKKTLQGQSYLEYLYGFKSYEESRTFLEGMQKDINEAGGKNVKFEDFKIDLMNEQGSAILIQIAPENNWRNIFGAGAATTGGLAVIGGVVAIVTAPVSVPVFLVIAGGSALIIGGTGLAIEGGGGSALDDKDYLNLNKAKGSIDLYSGPVVPTKVPGTETVYARPTLYTYNSEVLKGLNCDSFEVVPE